MTSTATHPYYVGKARAALTRAGAPDADPTALAVWAQAHRPHMGAGVFVDSAGRLVATTLHHSAPGRASASYVDEVLVPTDGLDLPVDIGHTVADLAAARLGRALGVPLVHLRVAELAHGPAIRP